eukprot:TCONS_00051433-protein
MMTSNQLKIDMIAAEQKAGKVKMEETCEHQITHFAVRFERKCRSFFTGECIEGFIDVDVNTSRILEDIALLFRGETLACWQDNEEAGQQNTMRVHRSHWKDEMIISDLSHGTESGNGIISFPFKMYLPDGKLPSSFESKFGAVRYWLKVSLSPGTVNCQYPFTVLEKINVNDKKYQKSVSSFTEKMICWMCFRYGGISLTANIDRSAYCPGEAIAVNCRAHNKANKEMGGLKARLVQTIQYKSEDNNKIKEVEVILKAIGGNRIQRNHTKVWDNQLLWVPSIPPTNKDGDPNDIIKVLYHVQISMEIPNDADLTLKLPVTIGTIPWKDNKTSQIQQQQQEKDRSWRFMKCTDGSDCFNRSSKRYQFPMQPFIPSTIFVQDYHPFLQKQVNNNQTLQRSKWKNDERQPLLQPRHA